MSIVVSTRSHGSVGLGRPSLVGRWPGVLGAVSAWALIGCGAKSEPASAPATSPASSPAAATSASEPAATKPRTDKNDAKKEVVAVAFDVTIDGVQSKIALSKAIVEGRGANAPMSAWSCEPNLGVRVVDFAIGDDPKRKGDAFVASVSVLGFQMAKAGVSREAELSFRRAGEPTLTLAKGTVVFDEGLMSGKASGTTEGGVKVELAWTCETGS